MHADDELAADDLMVSDVENAILTGKILERQKDAERGEWKYRVRGTACDGAPMEVVVKISATGKMIVITAYAL